jgi:hypothetical protein
MTEIVREALRLAIHEFARAYVTYDDDGWQGDSEPAYWVEANEDFIQAVLENFEQLVDEEFNAAAEMI